MPAAKAPYLTKAEIERFLQLEEQRKALTRQASELKKAADLLEQKIFDFVRAEGGKERTCTRSGYVLAIHLTKGTVKWKEEFVRVAGHDEAERLIAAAPPREDLTVQPVA